MYTLTLDLHNHYRIWVEGGLLRVERKTTAMGKEAIGEVVTFSATNHACWRIRHDDPVYAGPCEPPRWDRSTMP